jgi:hypothetical protein
MTGPRVVIGGAADPARRGFDDVFAVGDVAATDR